MGKDKTPAVNLTLKGVNGKSKNISKKHKDVQSPAKNKSSNTANGKVLAKEKKISKENAAASSVLGSLKDGVEKQKKSKNKEINVKLNNVSTEINIEKVLSEKDLAKIAKKKAKRLAQKLKNKGNKAAKAKLNEISEKDNPETEKLPDLAALAKKKAKRIAQKLKRNQKELQPKAEIVEKTKDGNGLIEKKNGNQNNKNTNTKSPKKSKEKKKQVKEKKEHNVHDPALQAATVFVGNLPVNTKRVQLIRLFQEYAPVNSIRFRTASGKVIFTNKIRKEAGSLNSWVVLKDSETAERALALNGTIFKNNHLRVTRSSLKNDTTDKDEIKCTIFVGNLKYSANEEKLREIFSSCGDIKYVRCLREGEKGCNGVAYVCFKTPDAVGLALELNETMLDERPIHVERYSVKKVGAKMARNTAMDEMKTKTGAKKRIDSKNKPENSGTPSKQKKSKFRGVKVEVMKNKQKKKVSSQMQKLAKKIAPRIKDS